MKQHTIKTYSFSELSDKAKEKAIEKLFEINVDDNWWETTYEDAERIKLKITEFDLDRANYCKGKFLASAEETAHKIEVEHGDTCETYKTAKAYLMERDQLIDTWPKNENGENQNEYLLDEELDELDDQFLKDLCEDYLKLLREDYEYLTSEKAIIESIEANDYEFLEDGKLYK